MIDLKRRHRAGRAGPEINMAPLVDMVFTLLLFFLVTTTFTRETGVEVSRPAAASAREMERDALLVALTRDGAIFVHNRAVDLLELRAVLQESLKETPDRPVVILADKASQTGGLVSVMDECALAGVKKVAVAAGKER
jgi:biopolymer transport protein ExbD